MQSSKPRRFAILPWMILLSVSAASVTWAQLAGTGSLPYQGLLEQNGVPLQGDQLLTFILENEAGGELDRVDDMMVTINDGVFAVNIAPLSKAALSTQPLYLRIEVGETALAGRQAITPAPASLRSETADDFLVDDALNANSVTSNSTTTSALTVNGPATVTGGSTIGSLQLGGVGVGGVWRGIRHGALSGATNFALLQQNDGSTTILNSTGSLHFRTNNSTRMTVNSAARVGVNMGATEPAGQMEINHGTIDGLVLTGTNETGWALRIHNAANTTYQVGMYASNDGFFYMTNRINGGTRARLDSNGNWTTSSDMRRKKEIVDAEAGMLAQVMQLRPVRYFYKQQDLRQAPHKQLGFLAQDVRELFPSFVQGDDDLTLNYAGLSTVAIAAVQELKIEKDEEVEALKAENEALRETLGELQSMLKQQSQRLDRIEGADRR